MAQAPNNQGNPGGGLYFNLTVNQTVTITHVNMAIGGNTALGAMCSVNLWLGPSTYVGNVTDPSLWTLVGSTTPYAKTTAAGATAANYEVVPPGTGTVIPVAAIASVTLAPGTYGFALESVNCNHGYTNGLGCVGTAPPGSCTNATGLTTELELRGGQAQNAFLSGGVFSPRIFSGSINFNASPVDPPITFAAREAYGDGCYASNQSWYEYYPNPGSNTLTNSSVRMTFMGDHYDVTVGNTPVDTASLVNPPLAHGPDGEILFDATTTPALTQPIIYASQGSTQVATEVNMNADGFVTLQGSTPTLWTAATIVDDIFLNSVPSVSTPGQAPASVGVFTFMDPSTGGTTHFDFNGTENLFTWQAVPHTPLGSFNTFQIAFFANGDIEIRWGAMSIGGGGGNPLVVGYIVDESLDSGSTPFQLAAPFSTGVSDSSPLTLEASTNPVIGTTVNLTTTNESTQPGVGICFVTEGQIIPGFDLGVIGAPGCLAHVDINLGAGFVIDNFPINGMTLAFPIPNSTSIVGLSFYCQSAWLDPMANAFGVTTSNGVRLAIGSF